MRIMMHVMHYVMHGKRAYHDAWEMLFFTDSGAPHHHQLMPSDKATGQYNTKSHRCSTIRSAKQDDIHGASNIILPCPGS